MPTKTPTAKRRPATAKTAGPRITKAARTILYVKDFDRALRFYSDVLGLKLAYPADDGWAEFDGGGTGICLHSGRTAKGAAKGIACVSFHVADFDAAYGALERRGVSLTPPSSPCAGLRYSSFADTEGNELAIEGA